MSDLTKIVGKHSVQTHPDKTKIMTNLKHVDIMSRKKSTTCQPEKRALVNIVHKHAHQHDQLVQRLGDWTEPLRSSVSMFFLRVERWVQRSSAQGQVSPILSDTSSLCVIVIIFRSRTRLGSLRNPYNISPRVWGRKSHPQSVSFRMYESSGDLSAAAELVAAIRTSGTRDLESGKARARMRDDAQLRVLASWGREYKGASADGFGHEVVR